MLPLLAIGGFIFSLVAFFTSQFDSDCKPREPPATTSSVMHALRAELRRRKQGDTSGAAAPGCADAAGSCGTQPFDDEFDSPRLAT